VVSGPSGSGKTTLATAVLAAQGLKKKLARSVSLTTRPMRPGEQDKKDYFFVSRKTFQGLLKAKKILEWTRYLEYYYATLKDFTEGQLEQGKSLVLCLDSKGARRIKRLYPKNTVTIFVLPPSLDTLRERISKRSDKTKPRELNLRMRMAKKELVLAGAYDHCLLNADLKQGVKELKKIILNKMEA
jgi:guanylate kinase